MRFLVDEDVSRAVGEVFASRGFTEFAAGIAQFRGQPDEALFEYAQKTKAVIVTADVDIANPIRFPLWEMTGLTLLRFSSSLRDATVAREVGRLIRGIKDADFRNLLIVEPGFIRIRPLSGF